MSTEVDRITPNRILSPQEACAAVGSGKTIARCRKCEVTHSRIHEWCQYFALMVRRLWYIGSHIGNRRYCQTPNNTTGRFTFYLEVIFFVMALYKPQAILLINKTNNNPYSLVNKKNLMHDRKQLYSRCTIAKWGTSLRYNSRYLHNFLAWSGHIHLSLSRIGSSLTNTILCISTNYIDNCPRGKKISIYLLM